MILHIYHRIPEGVQETLARWDNQEDLGEFMNAFRYSVIDVIS